MDKKVITRKYYSELVNNKKLIKKMKVFYINVDTDFKKRFIEIIVKNSMEYNELIDMDVYSDYLIELMDFIMSLYENNEWPISCYDLMELIKEEKVIESIRMIEEDYLRKYPMFNSGWFEDSESLLNFFFWEFG